jgi:hypothetical protein
MLKITASNAFVDNYDTWDFKAVWTSERVDAADGASFGMRLAVEPKQSEYVSA